jgi:phosphoribosyl 1,2-cyclic phosphate phosphodiesterase
MQERERGSGNQRTPSHGGEVNRDRWQILIIDGYQKASLPSRISSDIRDFLPSFEWTHIATSHFIDMAKWNPDRKPQREVPRMLRILGSCTSYGVPIIGCHCKVCQSSDPHDFRYRASALIRLPPNITVLIDSGPDFRLQCLSAQIDHIDSVLFTHAHADHVHGISDLLALSLHRHIELFLAQDVYDELLIRYPPIALPKFNVRINIFSGPFEIEGYTVVPIPVMHGVLRIHGFRIGSTAYITDAKEIPAASYALLAGVRELVINGLNPRGCPTHFTFAEMIDAIERIRPEKAFATHVSHSLTHEEMHLDFEARKLGRPGLTGVSIEPAYDGLEFPFEPRSRSEDALG